MRGHSYSFTDYMERATSPETITPDDDSYGHYCGFNEHDNSINNLKEKVIENFKKIILLLLLRKIV